MIKNIIIFGSNFGSIVHLKAIKMTKSFLKISICSPNIKKKNIKTNNIKIFDDYKDALKNNYDAVGIATPPKIQKKLCNYIIKKNIKKIKYILLEKPIAPKFKETREIITNLKKKKINFLVNFIFENITAFKKLIQVLKRKEIIYAEYKWKFKQMYFKNKLNTWKIQSRDGGGLVNYYLIHVFYNLFLFFNKLKIIKIENEKKQKIVSKIKLLIRGDDKIKIFVEMDINSSKNKHCLFFVTKNEKYNLINTSKNWVKNFYLYKNSKKIYFKYNKNSREDLTAENYKKLFASKYLKKEKIKKIIKSHKLCDEIVRKIYN
jgi:hypothetical protein